MLRVFQQQSSLGLLRILSSRVLPIVRRLNFQDGIVAVRVTLFPTSQLHTIHDIPDACRSLPGFQPTLVGGDGMFVPNCLYHDRRRRLDAVVEFALVDFVGYWPAQGTIVVVHEGTDPTNLYVGFRLNKSS